MGKEKPCNWCGHRRSDHEPHKYGRRALERAPRDYPCTISRCWCSGYEPPQGDPCSVAQTTSAEAPATSTDTKSAAIPSTSQ